MVRRTLAAVAGALLIAVLLAPLAHRHAAAARDAPVAGTECPACVAPAGQGQMLVETGAGLLSAQPCATLPEPPEAVSAPAALALAAHPVRGPPSLA